jgi:polyphenol oxidase
MDWIYHNGLTALQFPPLTAVPGIQHAIFLRRARDDQGRGSALNLGLGCGTPEQQVWHNRRRVRSFFGEGCMVFARQVHGARIAERNSAQIDTWQPDGDRVYLEGDALVTDRVDQLLFIQVADCQPILVVDPVRRVIANIHSGWRGSIQNIAGQTIEYMKRCFGCRAAHLLCGVGPSLGPCCAEFKAFRTEIPQQYWSYGDKYNHFDFWRLTRDQLTAAGVRPENVSTSGICTRCNAHLFFSYRADRNTGRFASVLALRNA